MKIVIAGTGTTRKGFIFCRSGFSPTWAIGSARKGFIAEERCGECGDEAIQTGPMALHILYFQKVQK
ncbi:MAG: hypothetical protein KUL81_13540 [Azonexus sp.]|nr:hypothetical protein [Azonexus sp.]